jgi:hypothetical protein
VPRTDHFPFLVSPLHQKGEYVVPPNEPTLALWVASLTIPNGEYAPPLGVKASEPRVPSQLPDKGYVSRAQEVELREGLGDLGLECKQIIVNDAWGGAHLRTRAKDVRQRPPLLTLNT